MSIITEGSCKINVELPPKEVHAQMEVFYNPIMKSNRNIAILLLNSVENEKMNLASPLAGSGIREVRFLKELKPGKVQNIFVNDIKDNFPKVMTENLRLNDVKKDLQDKLIIHNDDANLFLLNQVKHCRESAGKLRFQVPALCDAGEAGKERVAKNNSFCFSERIDEKFCGYFDYIEIDPFGTPNPFLASAVARITRNGIIAVTATDTAALTGTYPKVTRRKYWARAVRNYMMHEIGLRILIRKVQLQGVQFDKALIPIVAYHKDHYFRIYFRAVKGKEKCDEVLKQHQYLLFDPKTLEFKASQFNQEKGSDYFGPLWTGKLFDRKIITKMKTDNPFPEEQKFLDLLHQESKNDIIGFYDLHVMAKKYGLETTKIEPVLKEVKGVRTQFSGTGIKTKAGIREMVKAMKR